MTVEAACLVGQKVPPLKSEETIECKELLYFECPGSGRKSAIHVSPQCSGTDSWSSSIASILVQSSVQKTEQLC